jgi:hypothetical protein
MMDFNNTICPTPCLILHILALPLRFYASLKSGNADFEKAPIGRIQAEIARALIHFI